jgi:surfactin synthase thioesterase subunit
MSAAISRYLLTRPDPTARVRLFCIPHAGAGAGAYQPWVRATTGTGVAICPVQLPGRENRFRESAFTDLESLLDELMDALRPVTEQPFALFGHSLGALVAYGLALRLHRSGGPAPVRLFVSGRIAPQLKDPRPAMYDLDAASLIERLRSMGGIPSIVLDDSQLMSLLLPALRGDLAVNETYRHTTDLRLDCPITAFGGSSDDKVSVAELGRWREQTSTDFSQHLLPGGHFFLQSNLPEIIRLILADLAS